VFTHVPGVPAVVSQVSVVQALPSLHCCAVVHCAAACCTLPSFGEDSSELQPPAASVSSAAAPSARLMSIWEPPERPVVSVRTEIERGPEPAVSRSTKISSRAQTHVPATQRRGSAQTIPQPPQSELLVCVFTHWPEQYEPPAGHRHTPFWQLEPPVQSTPQPPQFAPLLARSTHTPPQRVVPRRQVHTPALHSEPPVHTTPQAPQFAGSACKSVQMPEHATAGGTHVWAHDPPVQKAPAAHEISQLPQCAGSLAVKTHAPSPQSSSPGAHVHDRSSHTRPVPHALPQAPQ
jgi:hypothetical protein